MSRNYSENVGVFELSSKFEELMVGVTPCTCGSEEHRDPPKHKAFFVKKVCKPLTDEEVRKVEKLAECPFWFKWMSGGGAECVKLPGRMALTRKDMAELVRDVAEAGEDRVATCEIYTDTGEEAIFVAHGDRRSLVVKGHGAVFAHVRAVCKDVCLRLFNDFDKKYHTAISESYLNYLIFSECVPLSKDQWIHFFAHVLVMVD